MNYINFTSDALFGFALLEAWRFPSMIAKDTFIQIDKGISSTKEIEKPLNQETFQDCAFKLAKIAGKYFGFSFASKLIQLPNISLESLKSSITEVFQIDPFANLNHETSLSRSAILGFSAASFLDSGFQIALATTHFTQNIVSIGRRYLSVGELSEVDPQFNEKKEAFDKLTNELIELEAKKEILLNPLKETIFKSLDDECKWALEECWGKIVTSDSLIVIHQSPFLRKMHISTQLISIEIRDNRIHDSITQAFNVISSNEFLEAINKYNFLNNEIDLLKQKIDLIKYGSSYNELAYKTALSGLSIIQNALFTLGYGLTYTQLSSLIDSTNPLYALELELKKSILFTTPPDSQISFLYQLSNFIKNSTDYGLKALCLMLLAKKGYHLSKAIYHASNYALGNPEQKNENHIKMNHSWKDLTSNLLLYSLLASGQNLIPNSITQGLGSLVSESIKENIILSIIKLNEYLPRFLTSLCTHTVVPSSVDANISVKFLSNESMGRLIFATPAIAKGIYDLSIVTFRMLQEYLLTDLKAKEEICRDKKEHWDSFKQPGQFMLFGLTLSHARMAMTNLANSLDFLTDAKQYGFNQAFYARKMGLVNLKPQSHVIKENSHESSSPQSTIPTFPKCNNSLTNQCVDVIFGYLNDNSFQSLSSNKKLCNNKDWRLILHPDKKPECPLIATHVYNSIYNYRKKIVNESQMNLLLFQGK